MNLSFINRHSHSGIFYLLLLIACAMVRMSPVFLLLPMLFLVLCYLLPVLSRKTNYLAVARTVCKIE